MLTFGELFHSLETDSLGGEGYARAILPREMRFGEHIGEKPEMSQFMEGNLVSLQDLDEWEWERFRRELEEKKQYVWIQLVDADTTDEESHRKRLAERIVEEAVEAMGGSDALRRTGSDFLDRFRGEGIEVRYVGERTFDFHVGSHFRWGECGHIIEVKDLKRGRRYGAVFGVRSHLLVATGEAFLKLKAWEDRARRYHPGGGNVSIPASVVAYGEYEERGGAKRPIEVRKMWVAF